jgi:hypothetical protein
MYVDDFFYILKKRWWWCVLVHTTTKKTLVKSVRLHWTETVVLMESKKYKQNFSWDVLGKLCVVIKIHILGILQKDFTLLQSVIYMKC